MAEINKVIVTWDNIPKVAERVVKATQKQFGLRLLSFSDQYLENTVYPWMDNHVHENYLFSGDPSKATLDDFISIEIRK